MGILQATAQRRTRSIRGDRVAPERRLFRTLDYYDRHDLSSSNTRKRGRESDA